MERRARTNVNTLNTDKISPTTCPLQWENTISRLTTRLHPDWYSGMHFPHKQRKLFKTRTVSCSEKGPNSPTCHSIPAAQRQGCGQHLPCRIGEKSLRVMGAARKCIRGPVFHPDLCMRHIIAYSCININTHTHTRRVYQLA